MHQVGYSAKYNSNRGKVLTKVSGIFYSLVGEFLGEKLPMIIFTNRISFKISLIHQIEFYENQRQAILYQQNQVQRDVQTIYDEHDTLEYSSVKFNLSN